MVVWTISTVDKTGLFLTVLDHIIGCELPFPAREHRRAIFFLVAADFFSQKTSIFMVSDNGGGQPTRCGYIRPQHQQ
jgi:hypothetical protein